MHLDQCTNFDWPIFSLFTVIIKCSISHTWIVECCLIFWSVESHKYHTTKSFGTNGMVCVVCKHAYHIYLFDLIWSSYTCATIRNMKIFHSESEWIAHTILELHMHTHVQTGCFCSQYTCYYYGRLQRWMSSRVCMCLLCITRVM